MPTVTEAIQSRFSAHSYDPTHVLSEQDVTGLIDLARHAPSAFNLQHWRFIAVHTKEAKAKMLVTVGRGGKTNWPQKPRKATSDILSIV
ncbi:nitroreductase family protein [Pseudomonas sp. KU26590]|uniref:nitroreductase family protein n=1 Tax=Pseudomonas sp. KU26590 TaxID=2991051 RepID=UPI00223DD751|nr:nitroreductase family protein [Pseudomonas sp. KU26590]UZJ57924.1 nitroreductase family protein [Pseudomonas sp. KU26590]